MRLAVRWTQLACLVVVGVGVTSCRSQSDSPAVPAAATTGGAATTGSATEATEPVDTGPEVPPEPPVRLRLMIPGADGVPARDYRGSLKRAGETLLSGVVGRPLAEAGEGVAVLLLVGGKALPKVPINTLVDVVARLGQNDRVAVGAITAGGFKRVYDFSGDVDGATAALHELRIKSGTERSADAPALHAGLQKGLDSFHARTGLPPVRAAILLTEGQDAGLKRTSLRQEARAAIQLRASYYQVPLHVVGFGDDEEALGRMKALALKAGGSYRHMRTYGAGAGRDSERIAKDLAARIRRWITFDADVRGLEQGRNDVTLVARAGDERERSYPGAIFVERFGGTIPVILGTPEAPEPVLPLGVSSADGIVARARAAEKAGRWVRAGALWHLAQRADTMNRKAVAEGNRVTTLVRKRGLGRGHVVRRGEEVAVDVAVERAFDLVATLSAELGTPRWRQPVVRMRKETPPLRKETPNGPKGDPNIERIILHRCNQATPKGCLRELLLTGGYGTHLFVDPAGVITQLVDLDRVVSQPDSDMDPASLSIHLAAPPDGAPFFQDPTAPRTWRRPRRWVPEARVNRQVVRGWDLTPAQYRSLVPLLRGLTTIHPDLAPVLPVDLDRRETAELLLHPEKYRGVLSHSNHAKSAGACPGPGLRRGYLNRAIQRWIRMTRSLDMEHWIPALAASGQQDVAVSLFEEVGPAAIPLLMEIATELDPATRDGALRALLAIAGPDNLPDLVKRLEVPLPTAGPLREVALHELRLITAILVRAASPSLLPAMASALRRLLRTRWAKHEEEGRVATRLLTAAIAAAATTAKDLEPLKPLLKSDDPELRGQAAVAWHTKGGAAAAAMLEPLLNDPNPWIRALAIGTRGKVGIKPALALAPTLGVGPVAELVGALSPKQPVKALLDLWEQADAVGRDRLAGLFVRWKWVAAVRPLAKRLAAADTIERIPLLRALRGITGRDLGEAPDGWLTWRPPQK